MSVSTLHIGLDIDGTLVDYNSLFLCLAVKVALVPQDTAPDKTVIRDLIRQNHNDKAWQALQAQAYGEQMPQACLFGGVLPALQQWSDEGHTVSIVSHKSQYTHLLGKNGPDLHHHARQCLHLWGVTDYVPMERIYFCPTRHDKCQQIAQLSCKVFVDDLPEVFADSSFPISTLPILFAPRGKASAVPYITCRNWREVSKALAASEHKT